MMNEVTEFFRKLFDTSDWPPRWHCGKWSDFHGWIYIISDLAIWSAYFAIPLLIMRFVVRQRQHVRFNKLYILFAAFILACGITHFLDAMMFWYPAYRISAIARFITGVLSWITVFQLLKLLPTAFSMKSAKELEQEVALRKLAEEALQKQNKLLNDSQQMAKVGSWEWNVKTAEIIWSNEQYRIWGWPAGSEVPYEKFMASIHPADKQYHAAHIAKALETKVYPVFTHRIITLDGEVRHILASGEVECNEAGEVIRMGGTSQDVTQLKQDEQHLYAKTLQLERKASELEQFAYVASHDLQEPLRKITSFTSMLKSGPDAADPQQGMIIDKIVKATGRMQQLIDDILNFSRASSGDVGFQTVSVAAILHFVLMDMDVVLESTNAKVISGELPELDGVPAQLQQVFQNLISNAIKFRREGVIPEINISASDLRGAELNSDERSWLRQYTGALNATQFDETLFSKILVKDNGIGFQPEYAEKIFQIFQRLHGRSEYEGTGIGLAICKRIIDNHHGLLYATGEPGIGATFTIILPYSQKSFAAV